MGLLITGSVWIFPFGTLIWVTRIVCGYALIVLFVTDFNTFILPNTIQFTLIVAGVLFTLPQLIYPSQVTSIIGSCGNALQVSIFANNLQLA